MFDRILIAQSSSASIVLVTADPLVAQYGGLIRKV
jgi:PIN domain nuclease of toxin-antitoxin system